MTLSSTVDTTGVSGIPPLVLGTIWDGLISACYEMGAVVHATAYSDPVREGNDYCAGLFDRRGRLVAQADFAPGLIGATPGVMQHFLDQYPIEDLNPGDVLVLNDPYMGSGHLPDVFLCSPIYADVELIGFAMTAAHHVDLGGAIPGSQVALGVTERYEEGLSLPPVRLVHRGVWNESLLRVIEHNVRLPGLLKGDLRAQVSANNTGAERLRGLVLRYGTGTFDAAVERIITDSERAMRDAILAIPDGKYRYVGSMDDFGPGTPPIEIIVTVTVTGDSVLADFTGSGEQTPSGINAPLNFTRGIVLFAIKAASMASTIPQNAGCIGPISVVAPLGSFFNPTNTTASSARSAIAIRIFEACLGALGGAMPERRTGENSYPGLATLIGVNPQGDRFVWWELLVGGTGARPSADGVEGMPVPFNLTSIPSEVLESHYPVLIERVELLCDSGGPGQFRGGVALQKEYRILDDLHLSSMTDRHIVASTGLDGGSSGALGSMVLTRDGRQVRLHSKGRYDLRAGDVLTITTSGSGGFGNPLLRDPELVWRDVVRKRVSAKEAHRAYGVVLTPDGSVDVAKTSSLRRRRSAED